MKQVFCLSIMYGYSDIVHFLNMSWVLVRLGSESGSAPSQARLRVSLGSESVLGPSQSWVRVSLGSGSVLGPSQPWVRVSLGPSQARVRVRLGSESGSGPSQSWSRVRLVRVRPGSESVSVPSLQYWEQHERRQLRSISVVVMHTGTAVVVRWQVLLGGCISSQVHCTGGCHPCLCHRAKVSPTQACNIKDNGELPCLPPPFSPPHIHLFAFLASHLSAPSVRSLPIFLDVPFLYPIMRSECFSFPCPASSYLLVTSLLFPFQLSLCASHLLASSPASTS